MSGRRHFDAYRRGNLARGGAPVMDDDALVESMGSMRVSDTPQTIARRKQEQLTRELSAMHLAPKAQSMLEAVTLNAFVERFSKTKDPRRASAYAHGIMAHWVRTHDRRGQLRTGVTATHKPRQRHVRG